MRFLPVPKKNFCILKAAKAERCFYLLLLPVCKTKWQEESRSINSELFFHHIIIRNINVFHREEKWWEITIFIDAACFDSQQNLFPFYSWFEGKTLWLYWWWRKKRKIVFAKRNILIYAAFLMFLFRGHVCLLIGSKTTLLTRFTNDMEIILLPRLTLMIDVVSQLLC